MRLPVEQAIQTATRTLEGRLACREAVTILASLTPQAVSAARELRKTDPERARTYQELIVALGRELHHRQYLSDEPRHLRAVTDDLARIHRALD